MGGDGLSDAIVAAAAVLSEDGLLVFTLEDLPADHAARRGGGGAGAEGEKAGGRELEEKEEEWRWVALPSGRYAHNAAWVTRHAAEAAGLRVVRRTPLPSLRVDAGTPVPGTLLVLQRRVGLIKPGDD